MMTRTMYDTTDPSQIPTQRQGILLAGYDDGLYDDIGTIKEQNPNAITVSIAVKASDRGQVLDVENGDASPSEVPTWLENTMAGTDNGHLTIYCNVNVWDAVKSAVSGAGIKSPNYWIAQWDGIAQIPDGAIAKQYKSETSPNIDVSVVAEYWPGVDPTPQPPTTPTPSVSEEDMPNFEIPAGIALSAGGTSFARGKYNNVAFFCDNTLVSGEADFGATIRVAIWASGEAPVVQTVSVTNHNSDQVVIPFPNAALTHSVTVSREDAKPFKVFAEVS